MLASDLMVAVAHQVEHRIVAPEVAGSRPVSHPIPFARKSPRLVEALRFVCLLTTVSQILPGAFLSGGGRATSFAGRKKKGAFHAPKVGVSGLGCLAVLGHP